MADSFASLFESQDASPKARRLRVGQAVEARVLSVSKSTVFLEVLDSATKSASGSKTQAYLEAAEVTDDDGNLTVKDGEVLLLRVLDNDEQSGSVRLGRAMGKGGTDLAQLQLARESGMPIEGKVAGVNKGGLEIELGGGVRAFCPSSQSGTRAPRGTPAEQVAADLQALVGQQLQFKVMEIKEQGRSIVLSRRALLDEAAADAKKRVLANLNKGQTVKGLVTAVRDFGFFVDLGGLEALVPRSEFSHEFTASLQGKITAGDAVEAQVLDIRTDDKGETKVSLAVKARLPAPERASLPPGTIVPGAVVDCTVVRIETYGVFAQVDGDETRAGRGLIPASELGVPRGTDLGKAFPEGTKLRATVLESAAGKLKLSVRGAKDAAERAEYEAVKDRGRAPRSLGTFGDLLKGFGAAKETKKKGR